VLATALLLAVASPRLALGWGGRLHFDITRSAARSVPDDMAAWRAYEDLLVPNSINPDLWKDNDEREGPRHFIDVERYRLSNISDLPRDFSALPGISAASKPEEDGIAPWVIMDLQQQLTAAMATNNWTLASRLASALAHYTGDIHQPLHCTENYNGQLTRNDGIHRRWEENMPEFFWRRHYLKADPARYLDDPWSAVITWIQKSFEDVEPILVADTEARKTSSGAVDSEAYFQSLWDRTRGLFTDHANAAATDLGSLWYTAWVNAGRPPIPPPPEDVSAASVWPTHVAATTAAPTAWPFLAALAIAVIFVAFLSLRKGAKAH
jgi:hypothetical protein